MNVVEVKIDSLSRLLENIENELEVAKRELYELNVLLSTLNEEKQPKEEKKEEVKNEEKSKTEAKGDVDGDTELDW